MKGGMAYVPGEEQAGIVYEEFRSHLERELEVRASVGPVNVPVTQARRRQATAKALPRLDEDNRIVPILENLSRGFQAGVSSEWANAEAGPDGALKADMIDEMAYKHFPACMRNLHIALRKDGHLKHFGRLQYGLFLKVRPVTYVSSRARLMHTVYRSSACRLRKRSHFGEKRSLEVTLRTTNSIKNTNTTFVIPTVWRASVQTMLRRGLCPCIF